MSRKTIKHLLVIIPTGDYAERLKLNGVLEYARDKVVSRWNLKLCVGVSIRWPQLLHRMSKPRPDGIIAYVQSDVERQMLLKFRRPTILIEDMSEPSRLIRRSGIATIVCDHIAEGRTAAEHFLSHHFRNFAFVGTEESVSWCDLRLQGFKQSLREKGYVCTVFDGKADLAFG